MSQPMNLVQYTKLDGVKDLYPISARAAFAKALMIEDAAGGTTPEAEAKLDEALEILEKVDQAK